LLQKKALNELERSAINDLLHSILRVNLNCFMNSMDTSVVDTILDWYYRFCFRQMPEYYLIVNTKLVAEVETILISTSLFAQKE
jgi:hypothetical protein